MTHALELAEHTIYPILNWLRLIFEIGAAAWIAIGLVIVIGALLREGIHREARYTAIRLAFSRCLSLALEFQLAADILATTIAPSLEELRQLAITAIIRTGLNYFLSKEMKEYESAVAEVRRAETS